jgi:diguanylate cyclase (GGDEF)-like protein
MSTLKLLTDFAFLVRQSTQAEAASLLFVSEPVREQGLLLIHSDTSLALPEMENEASAWAYLQQTDNTAHHIGLFKSQDPDGALIRLPLDHILDRPAATSRLQNERREKPDITTSPELDGALWIGLRKGTSSSRFINLLKENANQHLDTPVSLPAAQVNLSVKLAWSVYQQTDAANDPVSQLQGRMAFQVFLKRVLAAAKENSQDVSLLLVNPDDFTMVNHRYGREQGDLAIREIADVLGSSLRQTDGVFRYAGAVFAVVLPATGLEQCKAASEKVRRLLMQHKYLDNRERFSFSMGATAASAEQIVQLDIDATDLLMDADAVFNRAKVSGGARVIVNEFGAETVDGVDINPLSGVFTADSEKDYRNMLLLWETVSLVTENPEPTAMAHALIDRLAFGFQPDRIFLCDIEEELELTVRASNVLDNDVAGGRSSNREIEIKEKHQKLILQAIESKRAERIREEKEGEPVYTAFAVPLLSGDQVFACLFMDGRGRRLSFDSSDIIFLNALVKQMSIALDRARIAAGWINEKDRESRKLREELTVLRQTLDQGKMVYESDEMFALMDTLKRVAPSDATVLITGESGTGKEVLAQAVHRNSLRKDAPFVVFDCGAVAQSLLEAELFGHVKGAFTGAESASEGRIAQAAGGTLFLDEIGELPLQVQAKLLRFVQGKEYSPVGSSADSVVDVRIVAATNRKLQDEVAAGRFRADLYYRLQVISLQAIPLRHRRADILPLAHYYLERYAAQNGMDSCTLSSEAEEKLLGYDWPGNVRELQHAMLRSVLTSSSNNIDSEDIELLPETEAPDNYSVAPDKPTPALPNVDQKPIVDPHENPRPSPEGEEDDRWLPLRRELIRQIDLALQQNRAHPVPLGRWLTEDLVMAANEASGHIARQAATLIGLPESTFRRQMQKTESERSAGLASRTPSWESVRPLLNTIITRTQEDPSGNTDLVEQARSILLEDVEQKIAGRVSTGAALMGVTAPTYKRWLQSKESM